MKNLLAEAEAAFRDGKIEEAEATLRDVVASEPENAAACHMLGLIALGRGRHADALAEFSRAIAANPRFARAHVSLALAQVAIGDRTAAEASYRQAIALNPKLPMAVVNLAGLLMQEGRLAAAIELLRPAIKRMPDRFELRNNLGIALLRQGKTAQAVKAMQEALAVAPNLALAHANLARALRASGKLDEAAARYRRALEIEPDHAQMMTRLAEVEREQGNLSEAAFLAERAQRLDPKLTAASVALALCRLEQRRFAEAETEARRALGLDPSSSQASLALARILEQHGDPAEALAVVDALLASRPREAAARAERRLLLLKLGRYAEAWAEGPANSGTVPRGETGPAAWAGEAFPAKMLFLRHGGGLDDSLQFVRYAPLALSRGGKVVLQAPAQLRRLYADIPGIVLSDGPRPPEEAELQASLPDLPRLFGTTVEEIPADIPYLAPDQRLARLWADRLAYFPRPRIGLCWRPGIVVRNDARAIPLPLLMEAFAGIEASLISLQRDAARRQIAGVGRVFDPKSDPDYGSTAYEDFADMAALMANLDLVVTVDSSTAHLAGAIGRPTALLLPFAADWPWLTGRADSPWYPSLALIRQQKPDDWHGVVGKLGEVLLSEFPTQG
jgi:tetratricopeptide (TPR) repeat protein